MNVYEHIVLRSATPTKNLTKHLPWLNHTVEVMENRSRGWSQCPSALLPDSFGVEHRSNGRLMRRCRTDTSNAEVLEVYAELPSLYTGAFYPINDVKRGQHQVKPTRRTYREQRGEFSRARNLHRETGYGLTEHSSVWPVEGADLGSLRALGRPPDRNDRD